MFAVSLQYRQVVRIILFAHGGGLRLPRNLFRFVRPSILAVKQKNHIITIFGLYAGQNAAIYSVCSLRATQNIAIRSISSANGKIFKQGQTFYPLSSF